MEEGVLIRRGWIWLRVVGLAGAFAVVAVVLNLACGGPRPIAAPQVVDTSALQQRVAGAAGHPLLLVFWATWCKPCVEELPALVGLGAESPGGLHVLAVSLDAFLSGDSTLQVVQDYLAAHPAPLDHVVYRGTQDAIFAAFGLPGNIPFAILYDAKGQVLQRFSGAVDPAAVRTALQAS